MRHFNPDTEDDIKLATSTLWNFYTYLLYNEVCFEYREDIEQGRKTCILAQVELCKNLHLMRNGSGAFNKACSTLFGGHFFISEEANQSWLLNVNEDRDPLTLEVSRDVIKFGIAAACPFEKGSRFQKLTNENALAAKKLLDIDGFEVIAITEPDSSTHDFYYEFARGLKPVGKIQAKSFRDPAKPDIDMSPEERWEWDCGNAPEYQMEFFMEMDLLQYYYPGLKVITSVWKLNCDVYYFDEIISAYPSFYTVLPNEKMLEWKGPAKMNDMKLKGQEDIPQSGMQQAAEGA